MFSLPPLSEDFKIDENDFLHGLPKIMLGWLHLSEGVLQNPPKPTNYERSVEVHDLIKKFVADSNAVAQERGLEAALAYVENCDAAGKQVNVRGLSILYRVIRQVSDLCCNVVDRIF